MLWNSVSRASGSSTASSSRRKPRRTAPSRPMPPNSALGHATVKIGARKLPPAIACEPSPYPLRSTMVKNGTVRLAPMTNSRLKWRTWPVCSASGPTMNPGVSHRKRIGRSWASHSWRKRAALSAPSLSMAPPRWAGSLATTPTGRPSILIRAVTMPLANPSRSSNTDPVSASVVTTCGPRTPAAAPRGCRSGGGGGRAAHADRGVLGGDDHVTATEQGGVAGKAPPRADAHQGHQPTEPTEQGESHGVEPGDHRVVGVARPPTPSFGEEDHREPQALDQLEHPVLLAVVLLALGTGQHGVVVGEHRTRRTLVDEAAPVDPGEAGHQPVGRRPLDQLLERAPGPLGGNGIGPVLGEAARVAEVVDVLPRRPPAARVTSVHRLGAPCVEHQGSSVVQLGQIRSDGEGEHRRP